jgi:hypothetical protein
MVPGPLLGSAYEEEGEETSRSENETCLVVAGPLGIRLGACPAVAATAQTARRGIRFCAGLEDVKYCALGNEFFWDNWAKNTC